MLSGHRDLEGCTVLAHKDYQAELDPYANARQ